MAEGIAEVLRETMREHRVLWETTHDDDIMLARCKSCGYLSVELETWEHQANVAAEVLAANGYGKLEDAWDEGAEAAIRRENTYGAAEKAKFNNPYRRPE